MTYTGLSACGKAYLCHLVRLWELCRPEIEPRAGRGRGESSLGAWLDRRGLTFEEVATAAYPAVEDAASRYDPAKDKVLKSAERAALQVLAEQAEVEFSLHVYPKRDQKARYLSLDEAA